MNEITLQTTIQKFNYDKSVSKMQKKVGQWKRLTVELVRELYIAHQYLTTQEGQRKDPEAEDYIPYTWGEYCKEIGIEPRTAQNWLKRFIPAELSQSNQDILLTPEEVKKALEQKLIKETEGQEARIAYYEQTGQRPEGWTHADELELRKRNAKKTADALVAKWSESAVQKFKPRKDYFQEILNITSQKRKRFALPSQEYTIVQEETFISLDRYLCLFENYEERLMAAVNLQKRLKQVVNMYAEEQMLKYEAEGAQDE